MPRNLPHHPFDVVRMFEENVAAYTGAPYAIAVESCTNALSLAVKFFCKGWVNSRDGYVPPEIPTHTYVGVPQVICHHWGTVRFRREDWKGCYQLKPYPIWDCARRFTRNMYVPGQHQCVSFHWEKILGLGRGGAILTDDKDAAEWYRAARFDGRHEHTRPHEDTFQWGIHAYMIPEIAAAGLIRLFFLPDENPDQPDDYPDLSQQAIFQGG